MCIRDSGKTTIGRMLVALEKANSGSIRFEGTELSSMRGRDLGGHRKDLQLSLIHIWTEDLLAGDRHVPGDVREDGGRHEEPAVEPVGCVRPARQQPGPLADPLVDVHPHAVPLGGRHQGPETGRTVERVTGGERLRRRAGELLGLCLLYTSRCV